METLSGVRRLLAAILFIGMGGTLIELLLLGHVEDLVQLVPIVLLCAGLVAVGWHARARSAASAAAIRILMVLFVVAGFAGVYYHFTANLEFQKETDPSLAGRALVWKALEATVPPALSPGVMLQLGLVGIAYTYGHDGRRKEEP